MTFSLEKNPHLKATYVVWVNGKLRKCPDQKAAEERYKQQLRKWATSKGN